MKRIAGILLFLGIGSMTAAQPVMTEPRWEKWEQNVAVPTKGIRTAVPVKESIFSIDEVSLKNRLLSLAPGMESSIAISLPFPDGSLRKFQLWRDDIMESGLIEKYPRIRTFSGFMEGNKSVTAKFDYTEYGFHAMIFNGYETIFIDPYSNIPEGFYSSYRRSDYIRPQTQAMQCLYEKNIIATPAEPTRRPGKFRLHGHMKRTFRLALACTGEYAVAVAGPNPTKAAVLSKMITSINRVNGIYERELAVRMMLAANTDTLIFLSPGYHAVNNPFDNSNGGAMLSQNQILADQRIGPANYDIGHVFSTAGGGVAWTGGVCQNNFKARGVTGQLNPQGDPFDIDYVAHEMGHQFGADHTFNSNLFSCGGGNRDNGTAFEPGSGSTLMGYAGLCGNDDLQLHSDAYFHGGSLEQISDFLTSPNGGCALAASSQNTPPALPSFSKSYHIPKLTPFELTAPVITDTDHDTLTYCWEQWDRGNFGNTWNAPTVYGPIFRSFLPNASPTRVFPKLDTLLDGVTDYRGERLPNLARSLTFRLTVRDLFNGVGSFNLSDDSIQLNVSETAGPFKVLSPSSSVNWLGSSTETVHWDVANTNSAPINCSHVDILLSEDGGYTYPYTLVANTPNDGHETVTVPNVYTTTKARIKVKAVGNVFFNINPVDFIITHNTGIQNINWKEALTVFPVPAENMLHLMSSATTRLEVTIVNNLGQIVYRDELDKKLDIEVAKWAKGFYYVQFAQATTGERIIRPIIIK